ncbi:uncharacterized protein SPPG_04902 [Spizellomyces punctatus DAOM BR117]|uniref:N-acetyltransferase domain-containing protein n=1 Tax=Spizellomyces punctatus (strain DAOM BR117) TaxID=645134 RepID=A0A0L0HDF3_SPIPD|nr:uncharacterized protein SPPG_04902 [Spizellomyces punctatus DAOM BR117]KNC99510.1 hypothetical protein SPPG_04902 [Spizellomyces punctatus DAOM BR117]|eukprot:XP_016607550.1 hypothetical protein SPPG_04902 [Spizellomyces punctatus DAOM BR117]
MAQANGIVVHVTSHHHEQAAQVPDSPVSRPTFASRLYHLAALWLLAVLLISSLLALPVSLVFLPLAAVAAVPVVTAFTICLFCVRTIMGILDLEKHMIKALLRGRRTLIGQFKFVFQGLSVWLENKREFPVKREQFGVDLPDSDPAFTILRTPESGNEDNDSASTDLQDRSGQHANEARSDEVTSNLSQKDDESLSNKSMELEKEPLHQQTSYLERRSSLSEKPVAGLRHAPKVAVRHLRPGDEHFIAICHNLLLTTGTGEDLPPPRVGLVDDTEHHILSYWRADTGRNRPSDTLSTRDLVGFIEYFHGAEDSCHLCIDKLYVNTAYEGLGFSRRLIKELHRLPGIETIEVWSLWHTEHFYKEHGYTTVPHPQGGRVEAEWGPLLIWVKADNEVENPRASIIGSGAHGF